MARHLELDAHDRVGLIPLVLGIAFGDLLAGLPIDGKEQFTGSFWDLFTPYGVWMGLDAGGPEPDPRVDLPGPADRAAS